MFQFLGFLENTRKELGFGRLQWAMLVGDIWRNRNATDEEFEKIREDKYGKITPEQWAAIIQLILTLLPIFLG